MGGCAFVIGRSSHLDAAGISVSRRKRLVNVVVICQSDPDLFEVTFTLCSPSCFTCLLNSRKKQRHKNGDDRDDDKQFDQRETAS